MINGNIRVDALSREVLEETGYKPRTVKMIGSGTVSEGFTNEVHELGVCWVNTEDSKVKQNLDEGERITNGRWIKIDEFDPYIISLSGQKLLETFQNKELWEEIINHKKAWYDAIG